MTKLIYSRTEKITIITVIVLLLIIPAFSFVLAQDGRIVPCNGPDCNFSSFIELCNRIINFFIVIGASLGAISFAWAGWLYVTSGGNPGTLDKAKSIFRKVIVGFIIMLSAWLIIKLVLASLGYGDLSLGFISDLVR